MHFEASYHARPNAAGELVDVGVMLLGSDGVTFHALPGNETLERVLNDELAAASATLDPRDVFAYHIDAANGVTVEWSKPFSTAALSRAAAAQRCLQNLSG